MKNKKTMMMAGGVISVIIAALLLVGLYGVNLKTQLYNGDEATGFAETDMSKPCATLDQKDTALEESRKLELANQLLYNEKIDTLESINLLEHAYSTTRAENDSPGRTYRLEEIQREIRRLQDVIEDIRGKETINRNLIAEQGIILSLPTCPKVSPKPLASEGVEPIVEE